jgi:hypothetical protein
MAAKTITVDDDDSMNAAAEIVQVAATRIKAIKTYFADDKATANKLHKSICKKESDACGPYEEAREIAEGKIIPYRKTQKLQIAEQEQDLAESAKLAREELLKEAKKLRRQGRIEEAKALEEQAEQITAPILGDAAPEIEGVSEREPWGAEVTDPMALIIAIAEGRVPLKHTIIVAGQSREEDLVYFNQRVLDYLARTQMKDFDLPGAKAEQSLTLAVRGN